MAPSRKRKREAADDGDTIVVLPIRPIASLRSSERLPLKETPTRSNEGIQRRIARHVAVPKTTSCPQTTASAAQSTYLESNKVIPDHCCSSCLTRGGQAAYQCASESGSDMCTQCIRNKKSKCCVATIEERQAAAARCDHCIKRGFKACNGQNPCDVCIKHNTIGRCRPTVEANLGQSEDSTSQTTHVIQPAGQRTASGSASSTTKANTSRTQQKPVRPTKLAAEPSSVSLQAMSGTKPSIAVRVSKKRKVAIQSTLDDGDDTQAMALDALLQESAQEHCSPSPQASPDSVLGDDDSDHGREGSNTLSRTSDRFSGHTSENSLTKQNSSTDATSATEEDEPPRKPTRPLHEQSPVSERRPRRSRGRVSYAEVPLDAFSDDELATRSASDDSDASDVYEEGVAASTDSDEASAFGDSWNHRMSISEDEQDTEVEVQEVADDISTGDRPKLRQKPSTKKKAAQKAPRTGKGIDLSLPPMTTIEDIFEDMGARALQMGLSNVLKELEGHHINVATMCSGTESPILALDLLSKGFEKAGLPPLRIKHHFSAEIEATKQSYIERNFSPPLIFRDVREFIPDDSLTAITAYGAEARLPSEIDVLIAGFVCKDLSRLNSQQKTLDDDGESGDTFRAVYSLTKKTRPRIVLLENVKSESKVWDTIVSRWKEIDYEAGWLICDTKNYYLPQTRERMYMIAIDRRQYAEKATCIVDQWKELMRELRRQCSSPYEAFLVHLPQTPQEYNALISESDWALCKLRYDHIRSEQRLGILRPITRWDENGVVRPPDFANRAWFKSQSSRVYDAIDVAHLQAAQAGYDSLYKMAVWDVSQNVDRFKSELGMLPCITPSGCDFSTIRQTALNGSQLLLLQGMPMDKLIFTKETQKDRQDLAGNAMSTTIIGASLVSAVISGWSGFRPRTEPQSESPSQSSNDRRPSPVVELTDVKPMRMVKSVACKPGQRDLRSLESDAIQSARLCECEGDKRMSGTRLHVCSSCGHTACAQCAGNPTHNYSEAFHRDQNCRIPDEFQQHWKPQVPTRLIFSRFPDIQELMARFWPSEQHTKDYFDRLEQVDLANQQFCIRHMLRQDFGWKFIYSSNHARLELRVGKRVGLEWVLFVDSPAELPANSAVRQLFAQPVAHARIEESLTNVHWKVHVPQTSTHKVQITGSGPRHSSWRSQLGLSDYRNETVPSLLQIRTQDPDCSALIGDFSLLSDCGTASNSLYKRLDDPDLYLFLDPSLIGKPEEDSFVFSNDCNKKQYGETRIAAAYVDPSWRPWQVENQSVHDLKVAIPGQWLSMDVALEDAEIAVTVGMPSSAKSVADRSGGCSSAVVMLEAQLQERLPVQNFHDYAWALQHFLGLPEFSTWQACATKPVKGCLCAPQSPHILWHVDDAAIATPHEDRKAAALYERAMKTRPEIFQIRASSDTTSTCVQIALNVSALLHRAVGRLQNHSDTLQTAWRLLTDHANLPWVPFPKFRLLSNADDVPVRLTPAISYLKHAQPRSLSWMMKQEEGKTITVAEVEEAVDSNLGWRAEARAQVMLTVRGGVLADLPSFGKTVTTIALLTREFEQYAPEAIVENNQQSDAKMPALLDSAATLIVCPSHITLQWITELKTFLKFGRYELYNVLLVESFERLQELSIEDVQRSRVIIVSWSVFAEQEYISEMARFTAMPEPSIGGRRAFDTWLSRVVREVPDQLASLRSTSYEDFKHNTETKRAARSRDAAFSLTLPRSIQHGSSYTSFSAMQKSAGTSKTKAKRLPVAKSSTSLINESSRQIPLLHMFCFNRIVMDEYHYLNENKYISNVVSSVSVKHFSAHKRWVLSGTPALDCFSDVDQLASYLGIRIGRYCLDKNPNTTRHDRSNRADTTSVEEFLSQTEVMSRQWHQARHERAQEFLDSFVRQNAPSLEHIPCTEKIMPVGMDIGHHAVYLELSQHLISQRMNLKKLNNKKNSDRKERLNASLNNSESAEHALVKSTFMFEDASLDLLREKRTEQHHSTAADLRQLLSEFESLNRDDEISHYYDHYKHDICQSNWLGDQDVSREVRKLLVAAAKKPDRSTYLRLKGASDAIKTKESKKLLSELRETSRELASRVGSERFISAIQNLIGPLAGEQETEYFHCSSPSCEGAAELSQLHLVAHCGHMACEECLGSRTNTETCVEPHCNAAVQNVNLIRATDLTSNAGRHANKLDAIASLISKFDAGEQGIVFAPNDEIIEVLEQAFDQSSIAHQSLRGKTPLTTARLIEAFKNEPDPDEQAKVLILNLGSEAAAGVNLTNANHIIFVSPLLAKTQYEYDSAMAQAIARSRRYGQKKRVHIHHVMAQNTIDVDILEHRHKRHDGISSSGSTMKMPPALAQKQKTRLVQNKKGDMALVPASWLADCSARKTLGVDDNPKSFTSLISFSETFQGDE